MDDNLLVMYWEEKEKYNIKTVDKVYKSKT